MCTRPRARCAASKTDWPVETLTTAVRGRRHRRHSPRPAAASTMACALRSAWAARTARTARAARATQTARAARTARTARAMRAVWTARAMRAARTARA
eukprot:2486848-Prymnesium_polylepis.1